MSAKLSTPFHPCEQPYSREIIDVERGTIAYERIADCRRHAYRKIGSHWLCRLHLRSTFWQRRAA